MLLMLRSDFERAWAGKDPFQEVDGLEGDVYRHVKGRRTLKFQFHERYYFAKIHHGVGWIEIIKNLVSCKKPVLGAENEWRAIAKLNDLGIATMTTVAYGSHGLNPARRHSFIITEALEHTVSLEEYCACWRDKKPSFHIKRRLLEELANIASTMHQGGMSHRDFYLCHFLLHEEAAFSMHADVRPRLSVIDLHRALLSADLSRRWIVKDVAGLYFSALHIGLNRHDFLRFVMYYSRKPLRAALREENGFWRQVHDKAMQLEKKLKH